VEAFASKANGRHVRIFLGRQRDVFSPSLQAERVDPAAQVVPIKASSGDRDTRSA